MKRFCKALLGAYLLLPLLSFAQQDPRTEFASTITEADLKRHLSIIASAEMEGRETGTPGLQKAADYIEGQFRSFGLNKPPKHKNGYQQLYPLLRDTVIKASLEINKKKYSFGKDYMISVLNNPSSKFKAKQFVFVGYGISDKRYDDYEGKDVKGKIVVFFLGEPKKEGIFLISGTKAATHWTLTGMSKKAATAYEKGAVGALVINPVLEHLPPNYEKTARRTNLYYPRPAVVETPKVFTVSISRQMTRDLFGDASYEQWAAKAKETEPLNTFNKEVRMKMKLEYEKKPLTIHSMNVVAYMEGTDKKDEFLYITAHMDHLGKQGDKIFYGADDDGSGTVSVIELAEAFTKARAAGKGPRRSVVFMTVSGEEKGLWGSEYYTDNPLFPLEKATADLNIDMIGRIDPGRKKGDSTNYIYVVGDDKISTELKPLSESINRSFSKLELDYKFNDPKDEEHIYFRSDHYNFARKGVPIIFYFDGIHKDYHQTTDVVEEINFDILEKRARFIFNTAWEFANRDAMLKRDLPIPEEPKE